MIGIGESSFMQRPHWKQGRYAGSIHWGPADCVVNISPLLACKIVQDGKAVEFYCSRTITGTLEQSGKEYDFGSLGGSEPAFVVTADEMEEGIK